MVNKVYVVTGVSSGIGAAFVEEFIKNIKSDELLIGLGRKNLVNFHHKNYVSINTDLNNSESIIIAVKTISKLYKRVDVLINNAGVGYKGTIEDLTIQEIRNQFEVNFFGPVILTKLIIPLMRRQKSGHIINISSVASFVSTPTLGYYAATKSSLEKISDVLAQEVSDYNIKVSLLIPGAVKSSFGKNIKLTEKITTSAYRDLYSNWDLRFRNYFKIRNTSQEVAEAIISLMKWPRKRMFLSFRDRVMYLANKFLPDSIFKYFFINLFYKYER